MAKTSKDERECKLLSENEFLSITAKNQLEEFFKKLKPGENPKYYRGCIPRGREEKDKQWKA